MGNEKQVKQIPLELGMFALDAKTFYTPKSIRALAFFFLLLFFLVQIIYCILLLLCILAFRSNRWFGGRNIPFRGRDRKWQLFTWAHLPTPPLYLRKGTHSCFAHTFFKKLTARRKCICLMVWAVSRVFYRSHKHLQYSCISCVILWPLCRNGNPPVNCIQWHLIYWCGFLKQ